MISNKKFIYLILNLFFLIKLNDCDKNKSDDKSLYENSIAITSTIPSNLKSLIHEKSYASLVFYYQNWCDECLRQVLINLELEKEIVYWQKVVRFFVVNYDSQLAIEFNVSKSFEYKLAKPNSRSNHLLNLNLNDLNTKENLIKTILSTLLKLNETNDDFKRNSWPKLKPLDYLNLNTFNNKTLLFVNENNSIDKIQTSLSLILDFANYTDHLDILNCNETVFINSNQTKKHINLPAFYQFNELIKNFELISQGLNRIEFRDLIINKFSGINWKSIEVNNTKSKIKNITNDQIKQSNTVLPVHFRDLNNAIRKVYFSDFIRFKNISSDKLQIMTNLSSQFIEYFPYDNENTRRFLRRVTQWLKERNQTEPLRVDKFKSIIKAGAEGFLQSEQPYISCKGSQPYLRGYPCSIWLLFHSLTVQEYLKQTNTTNLSIKKLNFTSLKPHSVLKAMKGYIKNFLPCTECIKQFEEDSIDLENQLINPNSSILWLWREHNKINLKLKNSGSFTNDPEFPKQIYPTYEVCEKCYLKKPEMILNNFENLKEYFNETEIVNFLINQYRKESLKSSAAYLNKSIYLILIICSILFNNQINRFN